MPADEQIARVLIFYALALVLPFLTLLALVLIPLKRAGIARVFAGAFVATVLLQVVLMQAGNPGSQSWQEALQTYG
ncbi:hypothetical protein [Hymenobacter cellulosilyticus]|uniref:Uncharacterized protein n=1 Tax=Hymenobacter cellulosilyticus TaxID=2932248 RepID=A0A8T9QAS2_9BACT|nr:hypothetical protein [Hymenobacter cellulosilyticus]UOQ74265.1 hypothetical protein MUN79_10500 [Hymenobacter cellulosilyticus]